MQFKKRTGAALALALLLFNCNEQSENLATHQHLDDAPVFMSFPAVNNAGNARAQQGNYAVLMAEYLTAEESEQVGRTVYFKDVGNKQLSADFVPGLSLDGTDAISYYVDENRPSADISVAISTSAIDRAMQTWDNVKCSDLNMFKIPYDPSLQTGFIAALLGVGGSFSYVADVVHSGWLPGSFFDVLAPGGSSFILGVTFTIIFTDDNGNPADFDNNGKTDVAWREIYYNDAFLWRNGAHYDIETIALHEAGHGLSQGHFGSAFADSGKGKLHFSPRAVMNAAYSGVQTNIRATDNGGHCSIWASWPNQ